MRHSVYFSCPYNKSGSSEFMSLAITYLFGFAFFIVINMIVNKCMYVYGITFTLFFFIDGH